MKRATKRRKNCNHSYNESIMIKQPYAALTVAAVLNVYSPWYINASFETYNVTKFMDTKLRIWTYNSTQIYGAHECTVDDIETLNQDHVYFNRSYYLRHNKSVITTRLRGTFERRDPSLMAVGGRDTTADHTESLEFASDSYQCGVFRVSYRGGGRSGLKTKIEQESQSNHVWTTSKR
uniref:Lipocalin n=1 Tax=Rhipicephalus zambeziensis TaxID=60191 RepID=A0A224YLB1_9ACAR